MYNISYFKEDDKKVLFQFMETYPFAFLTGSTTSGNQIATQLPLLFEERDGHLFLQGHMMRNTDHHTAFVKNPKALAVFTGPSAYVSATWYSNPHIGSTWNYMSIHAKGTIYFRSDNFLRDLMKRFTLYFENDNHDSPTIIENLPDSYVNKMMPAIVGFEIHVDTLDNVFKLSQNRDEKSYLNIIAELEKKGGQSAAIAIEMRKRKDKLFPSSYQ